MLIFYECLKPGGVLYVDTTSSKMIDRELELNRYKEKTNGALIDFSETDTLDKIKKLRTWEPIMKVNNKIVYKFKRYSHYLPHLELRQILNDCGFRSVKKVKVDAEHYDVFMVTK